MSVGLRSGGKTVVVTVVPNGEGGYFPHVQVRRVGRLSHVDEDFVHLLNDYGTVESIPRSILLRIEQPERTGL